MGCGCTGAETGESRSQHPLSIVLSMSSWEDHEQMIDDQYLMESIEEDQKLAEDDDEEVEEE